MVALVVAGAGIGTSFIAFGRSNLKPLPAVPVGHGYVIRFPDGPLGYEKKGLAILDAATNLPAGTKVDLYYFSAEEENPGETDVKDGRIPIRLWNGFCHATERGLEGTTMKITAIVSPVSTEVLGGGGRIRQPAPPPPWQPPSVQAVLGPYFEKVSGDQVVEQGGQRELVASTLFQLPAGTCQKVYGDVPPGPFPQPPFTSCPNPDGALPVEAGDWNTTGDVASAFDAALTAGDTQTLHRLADPSVSSFGAWASTGSRHPSWTGNVPFGDPSVATGCGALVHLRTVGAQLAPSDGENAAMTYFLILRPDGWKVWGQLPVTP
ncbi:MAG: hypothetical protein E6G47_09810 [Actinobacteria bacterium]|nr:MAG: hypothetical protein E6G47_09810 [Actinomycetota bacterium]